VCRRAQFNSYAKTPQGKKVKRAGILRRNYKITEDEYSALYSEQRGLCAICGEMESKIHRNGTQLQLSVDHNHATGEVRALLCSSCNVGLGSFKDDPVRLAAAITYLQGAAKTEALEQKVGAAAV
jgi:hypothetical protein